MSEGRIGRRDAARRALMVLGGAVFAPTVLAGCGGEGAPLNCTSTEGLDAAQIATRTSQHYVDRSPHADKKCDGCRFFQAPQEQGRCGGCQVVPGPINPAGYCDLWAART